MAGGISIYSGITELLAVPPGGTSGQVLTKNSNGDFDTKWAAGGGGAVASVTGLNTDNTDAANPIVKISVDGVSVTGLGTPGSPLVSVGAGTTTYINTTKIDQTPAAGTYGTLAGTVNGSNAVFTVSNGAYASGSLMLFLNGQDLTQGASNDWVETSPAAGTLTFSVAPPTGSIIQAAYITQATTTGSANGPVILATVAGINAKSVAQTTLYTVPALKTAVIVAAIIRCTAASSITIGPTLSIGRNSATYNDIYASAAITALTTSAAGAGSMFGFMTVGMSSLAAAADVIKLNLTAASTGTSQVIAVDLIGYLL